MHKEKMEVFAKRYVSKNGFYTTCTYKIQLFRLRWKRCTKLHAVLIQSWKKNM